MRLKLKFGAIRGVVRGAVIFEVGLYVNLMTKKYDFDRVVLFVNFALRESIGFTGVLWDWWVVNRCVLMCYFFIKYMVFGWVRLKPYFIRVWWDFCVRMVIFGVVKSCKMLDFVGFYRSGYRSGVLGLVWVKCLGNADFTRGLWIEQICLFR